MKEKKIKECFADLEINDVILTLYKSDGPDDIEVEIVSKVLRFEDNEDNEDIVLCDIYMTKNISNVTQENYMADSYNVSLISDKNTKFIRFLYNSKNEIDILKEHYPEYFI